MFMGDDHSYAEYNIGSIHQKYLKNISVYQVHSLPLGILIQIGSTMIIPFFKRKPKKNKRKDKRKNKNLELKRIEWTRRWGLDEYHPFWFLSGFPPMIRKLINSGLIPHHATILDIGCGSGYLSFLLAEEGFKVVGIDFAKTAIDKAKQKFPGTLGMLEFYTADATKPAPFHDTFRVGIDRGTFHTLPNVNKPDYVKNIARLIEEGGCLIMLYALRQVMKLVKSNNDDHAVLLKDHISQLFSSDFAMENFQGPMIESHNREDILWFLIILRRRSSSI
jgi:SAM-dependent methyltransferase